MQVSGRFGRRCIEIACRGQTTRKGITCRNRCRNSSTAAAQVIGGVSSCGLMGEPVASHAAWLGEGELK